MRHIVLAIGLAAACCGTPSLADTPVESDADRALCEQHGGKVLSEGGSSYCSTPAQNAACVAENGENSAFDYQTGVCGDLTSEAGETSGGWTDVK